MCRFSAADPTALFFCEPRPLPRHRGHGPGSLLLRLFLFRCLQFGDAHTFWSSSSAHYLPMPLFSHLENPNPHSRAPRSPHGPLISPLFFSRAPIPPSSHTDLHLQQHVVLTPPSHKDVCIATAFRLDSHPTPTPTVHEWHLGNPLSHETSSQQQN